jgi:hypothetical protein
VAVLEDEVVELSVSDQMLLTGLVSCLLTSSSDGSFSSVPAANAEPALTTRNSAITS